MTVLDLARLALHKDTRDAIREAVELLKRRPEWKRDIILLSERFSGENRHLCDALLEFSVSVLEERGWPARSRESVRYAGREILENAFSHGLCQQPDGLVTVECTLTPDVYLMRCRDPGRGFDLDRVLADHDPGTSADGGMHGLATVRRLCAALRVERTPSGPCCVEFQVFRCQPLFRHRAEDDMDVLSIAGDLRHEFVGRFEEEQALLAEPRPGRRAVAVEADGYMCSAGLRALARLARTVQEQQCRFFLVSLSPVLTEILEISRMGRVVDVVDSIEHARREMG
jgi:anti-anti-sigma factor